MQAKKIKTEEDPCLQPACTVLNYSEKKRFKAVFSGNRVAKDNKYSF